MPAMLRILVLVFGIFSLTSCASTIPGIYLKKNDTQMELSKEAYGIESLSISRDGQYLLTGDNGGWTMGGGFGSGKSSLRLWDLTQGNQVLRLRDPSGTIISVAISPDNKYAVTGGFLPTRGLLNLAPSRMPPLKIWDLTTGKVIKTYERLEGFRGNEFNSISFSSDGRYFLTADWTSVYIFDARTGNLAKTLTPRDYSPPSIIPYKSFVAAFSPDGRFVLSGGPDAIVRLWSLESGAEIKRFLGHKAGFLHGGISSVAFSPDGRYAMTNAYNDGNVILWDIEKGVEARRFSGFESVLGMYFSDQTLSFSPDGRHVLIWAKIWDYKTGEGLADFTHAWKGIKTAGRNPSSALYHPNGRYALLTPNDAAVRIYDTQTGEEIAVLVGFEDGEWLTITSEGYYNSSEKGAEYLSVMVDEKKYDMNLFYDVFYRPDIVAAKLRGEDISGLVSLTMKDAIKSPPPTVEFTTFPSDTDKTTVKICYQAKSTGGGIGELRLFHNGKLIESDGYYREAKKTGADNTELLALNSKAIYEGLRSIKIQEKGAEPSTVLTKSKGEIFQDCKEIDAIPGENEVSVTAFNQDNTVQGYMKTGRFKARIKAEEPHLYILSIGIDQYRDNTVNLKYAVKDAGDMKETLRRQAETLYSPQNIHYEILADQNATKANIIKKIDELSRKIKPTDSFILFVAGHGVLLQNQYYMLTHEYDGKLAGESMINSNEIVEMSKKIKSLSQLLIFDTCHAGGVDYTIRGLYDARMAVLAKKMGLHIYASASDRQAAIDGYEGNGLFTYTLLDGLNNNPKADVNNEGKVSVVGLGRYSQRMTVDLSREMGRSQVPLTINFGKDYPLYRLR
jgi:WD40 repeat protein